MNRSSPFRNAAAPAIWSARLTTVALAVVIAAAAVAALAGCGTAKAPMGSGQASDGSGGAATACAASALRLTLDRHAAGAAAGTSLLPLDATNTSSASCSLEGFPAVSFATARAGSQVGPPGSADRTIRVRTVVLAPGHSAHAWLRLASAMNFPAARCQPVTAAGFRVRLPGSTAATFLGVPTLTCAKTVKGSEILAVEPFQPGLAVRGSA